MENKKHRRDGLSRRMTWPLLCVLLGVAFAGAALAQTIPLYQNTAVQNYVIPGNPPNPPIDAVSFFNNSQFNVNFTALTINTELFETQNTVNYTNVGVMASDNGFLFDTQTTNNLTPRLMAGSFDNTGVIDCGLASDTNIDFELAAGQLIVWATNIVVNNNGRLQIGADGLLQLTGVNVDLTRSQLTMEASDQEIFFNNIGTIFFGGLGFIGFQNIFGINGLTGLDSGVGTDTLGDWVPRFSLTTNSATSSLFATVLITNNVNQVSLPGSTAYIDIEPRTTNYTVVKGVFLLNSNPKVAANVYFNPDTGFFGDGTADVELSGPYTDPNTGLPSTNYLYLNDDYLLGASLNNTNTFGNIPENFTFTESPTNIPLGIPPTPSGFPTNFAFTPGAVTNTYSYTSVQFSSTTVATNSPSPNVTNYLAILPGRIQITASNELNLSLARITGPNYLSIYAPHQFDGSDSAHIFSPYADINIGVTNGFLTVSNLLQPGSASWSGTLQAWSATWIAVDVNGVTNDYRVLLVSSQLAPTTPSQIQNLTLHGTNTIVISDALNVISTFSADAQNLILTTNGSGASSPDGELNLQSPGILWDSSTPNLRNLTNNGAIRTPTIATFGTAPPANYLNLVNYGLISDQGSQIWTTNFVNSGAFSNGVNSFTLQSQAATLAGGSVTAGGNVSITTGNLLASNVLISAGQALTIAATNNLTDTGVTNGNIWSVGGSLGVGLGLPIKPLTGDLLGTTITNIALDNQNANTWAGNDLGYSTAGYMNNAAIGRFILNTVITNLGDLPPYTQFTFTGTGASNAMYVDYLELRGYATNHSSGTVQSLTFDPNLVIYYAQAVINGVSVAEKINHNNGDHLRWLPAYAGYFSSTNIVYTNIFNGMTNITTNTFNTSLAQSTTYDSDGDGIVNAEDSTPFYVAGEMNFRLTVTNLPPLTALVSWQTIPGAANYLNYRTNLVTGAWLPLTNFITPAPNGSGLTTVTVSDPVNLTAPKFYQVQVNPSTAPPYGPGP